MLFEHDKHQYFFEKYLRGDMPAEEKQAFEMRLQTDKSLYNAFEYYKQNREEILKEELKEYNEPILNAPKKPEKWGWLYLIISIFGLVLVVDYFIAISYNPSKNRTKRKALIERINVFKSEPKAQVVKLNELKKEQGEEILKIKTDEETYEAELDELQHEKDSTTMLLDNIDKQFESYLKVTSNNQMEGDYLLFDSIFTVVDEVKLKNRINTLNQNTDSLLADSVIYFLSLKAILRRPDKDTKLVFAEFWHSPVNFKGYRFSGKKIQIYGVPFSTLFYFTYNTTDDKYYLHNGTQRYEIVKDNFFHKFRTE